MKLELHWTPFLMLLNREIKRFGKVLAQTVFTPIITSALYLLIFGVSLGKSIQMEGGISYLAFLIPGLIMMGVLNNAFQNSSSSIVSGKFSGDLEDYKASPISHQQMIWAMSVGGLIRGLLVGLLTFIVSQVFSKVVLGEWVQIARPEILMFFIIVGGLSFAKLGMAAAFWARTFDQMSAVGSFILLPLIYLGGVFFSIENLHPFWQTLSKFNPLLYLINGVRFGVLGISDVSVGVAAVVALATLVVFHLVALRALKTGTYKRW